MIPSSGCPPWPPDHPRTLPRTGTPTPPRGARPGGADRDPSPWQEPASADERLLTAMSALAEIERIEGLVAPLDVAAFRRNRAQIARFSTAILSEAEGRE